MSEAERPRVRIPTPLRELAERNDEVEVDGPTIRDALDDLVRRYPRLRRHLMTDDGELRAYVNIYLNEEDVRYLAGDGSRVADGDVITIVPSIAGG